jgi:hypothetical protein
MGLGARAGFATPFDPWDTGTFYDVLDSSRRTIGRFFGSL